MREPRANIDHRIVTNARRRRRRRIERDLEEYDIGEWRDCVCAQHDGTERGYDLLLRHRRRNWNTDKSPMYIQTFFERTRRVHGINETRRNENRTLMLVILFLWLNVVVIFFFFRIVI